MKYFALFMSIILGAIGFLCAMAYFELYFGIIEGSEIPIVLSGTDEYVLAFDTVVIGQDILSPVIAIVAIILCLYFSSLYHRLKRKKKSVLTKEEIKSPYVLYLRSFAADKITWKNASYISDQRSEEEVLVSVLSDIAPVYAIGDPADKKMPLGASRLYVDNEHWKSTVEYMAKDAVLVVLRLGKTSSFWWEVEMALKSVDCKKLLFVVPYSRTFDNVATLYKMMLDHGIDISSLNVAVEKKRMGSISSFVYFDEEGKVKTTQVNVPRLTKTVYSYEDILRNSLSQFLSMFGLIVKKRRSVRFARLISFSMILSLVFCVFSKSFGDYAVLKHQMPYELVEKCVQYPQFVEKYSDEINGNNLCYSLVEARKGYYLLTDDEFLCLFFMECQLFYEMEEDEFMQTFEQPKGTLLMMKKYLPERYEDYVAILARSAYLSLDNPERVQDLKDEYNSRVDELPDWLKDFLKNGCSQYDYDFFTRYHDLLVSHASDENIAETLRILISIR